MAQTVKNLPATQETWVQSLGWEDPLEKEMATHSSILAWRIPWTEDPGRLQSIPSLRHNWSDLAYTHTHTHVQGVCSEVHMMRSELSVSGCAPSGMALFRALVLGTWESLHSPLWNNFPLSFLPYFLMDWAFMEAENPTIRIILWSLQGPSLRQKYPGENSPRNN